MRNQKSKRKNRGGALDCKNEGGILTRSSNGTCPYGYNKVDNDNNNNKQNIKNTNQDIKVKSPVVKCKRDNEKISQSFLVSELEKTTIKVDNKEEERPLCPTGYYFDTVSKTPVAYQEMISEEKANEIMKKYNIMAEEQPLEEQPSSGGKQKRKTFKRRKQRKQRKTSKK